VHNSHELQVALAAFRKNVNWDGKSTMKFNHGGMVYDGYEITVRGMDDTKLHAIIHATITSQLMRRPEFGYYPGQINSFNCNVCSKSTNESVEVLIRQCRAALRQRASGKYQMALAHPDLCTIYFRVNGILMRATAFCREVSDDGDKVTTVSFGCEWHRDIETAAHKLSCYEEHPWIGEMDGCIYTGMNEPRARALITWCKLPHGVTCDCQKVMDELNKRDPEPLIQAFATGLHARLCIESLVRVLEAEVGLLQIIADFCCRPVEGRCCGRFSAFHAARIMGTS